MTKLDDLKLLHKNLTQISNQVNTVKGLVSTSLPDDAVAINTKLDSVSSALDDAKFVVRNAAGVEAMKNGGTNP